MTFVQDRITSPLHNNFSYFNELSSTNCTYLTLSTSAKQNYILMKNKGNIQEQVRTKRCDTNGIINAKIESSNCNLKIIVTFSAISRWGEKKAVSGRELK